MAFMSAYGFTSVAEMSGKLRAINERGRRIAVQIDDTVQDILKDFNQTRELGYVLDVSIPEISDKEQYAGTWRLGSGSQYLSSFVSVFLMHIVDHDSFMIVVSGDSSGEIQRVLRTHLPDDALKSLESE